MIHCVFCGSEILESLAQPVCNTCFFAKKKELLENGTGSPWPNQQVYGFSGLVGSYSNNPNSQAFEIPISYFIYSDREPEKSDKKVRRAKGRMIR